MKTQLLRLSVFFATFLMLAASAHAYTETADLTVEASVVQACAVSTSAINFGSMPSGFFEVSGTGSITVNCSLGASYQIALNEGLNVHGMRVITHESDASEIIPYGLYQDSGTLTSWGNTGYGDTISGTPKAGTGIGGDEVHSVFAVLTGGSIARLAGNYSDTVTVTVHY